MVHYIPGLTISLTAPRITDVSALADQFDLAGFMADFDATGADWLIFTSGQNTGAYLSPNSLLDRWAGPGRCSHRDLLGEIATEMKKRGKRFICYAPCEANSNDSLHAAFRWTTEPGTDQAEFQQRYTEFLREWAVRWGTNLDGWWMDGCYQWDLFHNARMNWPLWYSAMRAGNPEAAVAFNDGSFCVGNVNPIVPDHDYLAGETEQLIDGKIALGREEPLNLYLPQAGTIGSGGTQWHSLLPIDSFWGYGNFTEANAKMFPLLVKRYKLIPDGHPGPMEEPIYSDEELGGFLRHCRSVGGGVTLNVGIYQEGRLGPETIAQLRRLRIGS